MLSEIRNPITYMFMFVFCMVLFYILGSLDPSYPILANLFVSFWFTSGCLYIFELWRYNHTSLSHAAAKQFASYIFFSLFAEICIIIFLLILPEKGLEYSSFTLLFILIFVPFETKLLR